MLSVDGTELSRQKIEHTIPTSGSTRTPVDDSYKLPLRFTWTINQLTIKTGPEQLAAEDRERMKRALATAQDGLSAGHHRTWVPAYRGRYPHWRWVGKDPRIAVSAFGHDGSASRCRLCRPGAASRAGSGTRTSPCRTRISRILPSTCSSCPASKRKGIDDGMLCACPRAKRHKRNAVPSA